uniref:Uncharacterized protein n=1 Tax=Equus asinus TaxID=9793 RepID=A0A8C4PPI5_EQUAS
MTTSWRLRRRSTAARKAPRSAFSRAESPYTAASSAPSTAASSTTCTARPSAASAPRSCSARRLLPLPGRPHNTTSGILPPRGHVQPRRVNLRQDNSRMLVPLHSLYPVTLSNCLFNNHFNHSASPWLGIYR